MHVWWARRPLAACRAVIFASLVDDPNDPAAPPAYVEACRNLPLGKNAAEYDTPRQRLFDFIERLVLWESMTDEGVLHTARDLILLATEGSPPPLLDPFAGGGSIPIEAHRLGLEVRAGDLNPVAVLINKAQIEIPPRFANHPPVNPTDYVKLGGGASWKNTAGLAADVRYYGKWMRDRAFECIGHLYPECNGETVIAWLWARTVRCPNPACGAQMPLVRSFDLSKKKGRRAWVEPKVDTKSRTVKFEVRQNQAKGKGPEGTVDRRGVTCLVCGTPASLDHVRAEGQSGRMSAQLMAIVTEGHRRRNYYAPNADHAETARSAMPEWKPEEKVTTPSHDVDRLPMYGMYTWGDAFTPRQLVALTTFSDLVAETRKQIHIDAVAAGLPDDDVPLRDGGSGARAYAEGVSAYLGLAVSNSANYMSTLCGWNSTNENIKNTFSRQALPMTWDFAENNPFGSKLPITSFFDWIGNALETLQLTQPGSWSRQLVLLHV